jgi:hypothetical protein
MAANPSTEQKAAAQQTRKITTYDLVIERRTESLSDKLLHF